MEYLATYLRPPSSSFPAPLEPLIANLKVRLLLNNLWLLSNHCNAAADWGGGRQSSPCSGESYAAIYVTSFYSFSPSQRNHPWSRQTFHGSRHPHFEADWTSWRDVLIGRKCITTGSVGLVTLIIWSSAEIQLELGSSNECISLSSLKL